MSEPVDKAAHPSPFLVDEATDEVLRLHLDQFEGPLDVLLYLIKAQEIDIFDIPIVKITDQYLGFLEMMREENLEMTGEFLILAATLIQIKSRMLLPPEAAPDEEQEMEEEDPRLELVEKLLEYRRYREVSERLALLEEERANWFARLAKPEQEEREEEVELLEVTLYDLTEAFRNVLRFFTEDLVHTVEGEAFSVDEKIEYIEDRLGREGSLGWTDLFRSCGSRAELLCCFLAILELCRTGRVRAHQHHAFGEIRLFPASEKVVG